MVRSRQSGIMLIELMVGLFIGLLTTFAIVQVLVYSEGQRRTAMSGADAQTGGALALHSLQRDLRQAGYGLLDNPAALGCPVSDTAATAVFDLAPVVISATNDDAGSYQLEIFSSGKGGASVPLLVTEDHLSGKQFVVRSSFSVYTDATASATGDYSNNDQIVAVPEAWSADTLECTLFTAASTTSTATSSTVVASANVSSTYASQSYLINLGPAMNYRRYVLSGNTLQVFGSIGAATPVDGFPDVVNLQALYGKDTDSDGMVDTYDTTTPTTAAGWAQVLSVRVALVVRSAEYEKDEVTTAAPEWDLGTAITVTGTDDCASGSGGQCLAVKIDHLDNWKHYRYKIYDTMIPLRNVLWNS
jgi:type IV pilus assembly protein PilW